ncbi:MAG: hypothetical protein ACTS6A_03005 [Candidatus Hodgkinia cicadicola]
MEMWKNLHCYANLYTFSSEVLLVAINIFSNFCSTLSTLFWTLLTLSANLTSRSFINISLGLILSKRS